MLRVKTVLFMLLVSTFFLPLPSFAERQSEPEKLEQLITKINERQSKNIKNFKKKAEAYFFETQSPEVIERLTKEFPPGEVVTIIVLSNLSKGPVKEIVKMRKTQMSWRDIAGQTGVKLKNMIKEVKDFRLGIG
ncbi:MAG: hypothetical protein A2X59_10925 [Nitrospirae bacterium GWC2_42_7]|nr:MAG: hypothetical protein A2X59_10925 [Nitrospirae bacterium GWC2_42_7]